MKTVPAPSVLDAGFEIAWDGFCSNYDRSPRRRNRYSPNWLPAFAGLAKSAITTHPFHLLMHEGKLTRGQFRRGRSIATTTRATSR